MRPGKTSYIPLILYFILAGMLPFLDLGGNTRGWHSLAQRLTTPAEEKLFRLRAGGVGALTGIWGKTSKETGKRISELEIRNAFLEAQISQMGAMREENEHMRYLLGAGLPANWKFQPAKVSTAYADSIFVGEVGGGGEATGKIVISTEGKGGNFVGKVEKVVGSQAEVFLPTKDGSKIPVKVRDKDNGDLRASGILVGRGGRMILDQVLTGEVLKLDSLVVTSGDEHMPGELLVGKVSKILPISSGAFQQAEVTQAIDYNKLNVVFVITKF